MTRPAGFFISGQSFVVSAMPPCIPRQGFEQEGQTAVAILRYWLKATVRVPTYAILDREGDVATRPGMPRSSRQMSLSLPASEVPSMMGARGVFSSVGTTSGTHDSAVAVLRRMTRTVSIVLPPFHLDLRQNRPIVARPINASAPGDGPVPGTR